MKLIVQIPCFDEAATIARVVAEIPRSIPGIDEVRVLVVDDGSTDGTAEAARAAGADMVLRLPRNQGLARAFMAGLERALQEGADVIVNTDADNQYVGAVIPELIAPILEGRAEIVIGARPIGSTADFSWLKKRLQGLGSWVVRVVSRTRVPDAPSGFRAFSREAAMRLNVFTEYTYTLETVIQAGLKSMAIASVPVRTNPSVRPSRLVRSTGSYVYRSALTIVRILMTYRPFKFFALPGVVSLAAGLVLGLRFLFFYLAGEGEGHVQSVILSALLLGLGTFLVVVGLIADLVAVNRKLLEKLDYRLARVEDEVLRER